MAKAILSMTVMVGTLVAAGDSASAITSIVPRPKTFGYDISWPQCGHSLPRGGRFAIVGINGGQPDTRNPCFRHQLRWAKRLPGFRDQPKVAVYVNTANPGPAVRRWPKNDLDPLTRLTDRNPFGRCAGGDTGACAWQYGWNMAEKDAWQRGIKSPRAFKWWLDVEITNFWESNRTRNRAFLVGMVQYFRSIKAPVGLYSTSYQWHQIAGMIYHSSPLNGLENWEPGASTARDARSNCRARPFTGSSYVTVTQWYTARSAVDIDYVCPHPYPFQRKPPAR